MDEPSHDTRAPAILHSYAIIYPAATPPTANTTPAASVTADAPAAPVEKINICHINAVIEIGLLGTVISIPLHALPAHEAHFDYPTTSLNVGDLCGTIE